MRKTPNGDATYYSLFTEILKFYLHAFDVELPQAYSHFYELSKVRNVILHMYHMYYAFFKIGAILEHFHLLAIHFRLESFAPHYMDELDLNNIFKGYIDVGEEMCWL